jgi:dihydroxyacetone kinase
MTSLNGLGFSITLLNVVNTDIGGPGMIELLDAPSEVTGWAAPIQKTTWEAKNTAVRTDAVKENQEIKPSGLTVDASGASTALTTGLEKVIAAEPEITRYDTVVGDGDCGIGLKRGAEGECLAVNPRYLDSTVLTPSKNSHPEAPRTKAPDGRHRG